MNRIQELIKELCPNGVEWKKLGEVASYSKTRISASLLNESNYISVENLLQNCAGKVNSSCCPKEGNWIKYSCGDILIGNIRPNLRKIWLANIDGGTNGDVLVLHIDAEYALLLNPSFLYYILSSEKFFLYHIKNAQGGKMPRGDKASVLKYEIPLPPLPVQTEIVRILDKFVEQQEQLEKLIELRKKQYEYYREEMLTAKEGWETVTIGDLCTITRGRRFVRDDVRSSGMPCIHYGDMYTYYGITARTTKTFLDRDFPKKMQYAKKGDVVVVGAGENDLDIGVGTVWEGDEPAAVHDACYILEHKQNPKYIAYFLRTNNYHQQLRKFVSEGKICSISGTGLGSCFIPLPSLTKQQEIVDFLDKFEDNISVMKSTLEASKKRYEHYRDEMLRF